MPAPSGAAGTLRALPFLLIAAIAPGCRHHSSAPRPIRIAVHSDPVTLDPHLHNEILTHSILLNIYDGLTAFDADLRVRPNLASYWENPDDETWLFYLRPKARFQDGRPVQAEDVVFSLDRVRHHPRSGLASFIVEISSARVVDDHTVEVKTKRPFACLLNKLAFLAIVPRDSPDEITAPVGSGPYRLASYAPGRIIRLDPDTNPWRDEGVASPPIEFLPVRDAQRRVEMLLKGEADIVQDLLASEVARVRTSRDCRAAVRTSSVVEYIHMSPRDARFADRRVREAISLALDRARLVETILDGYGEPASQLVSPGVFGFNPDLRPEQDDLARARHLLAEAGFGEGFAVELEFRNGRRGDIIASQLEALGLHVTQKSSPWPELYARLSSGEVPFYYGGVVAPTADASDIFDSFIHTPDPARGYGQTNFNRYSNPPLDRLIEGSDVTMDTLDRRALLQRCMATLMSDAYILPVLIPYDLYGIRRDIDWTPPIDRRLRGSDMRRIGAAW